MTGPLTAHQLDVLTLVADGLTNRAVGHRLGVAEGSIATQMRIVLRLLDARDRTHAVAIAYQRGLIVMPAGSRPRVHTPGPPRHLPPILRGAHPR